MKLKLNGVMALAMLLWAASDVRAISIGSSQQASERGIFDKAVQKMNEKD